MEIYKTYKHNPPHLFNSNSKYFITGAIYQKRMLLRSDEAKHRLIQSLKQGFDSTGWKLEEWVVLNNHYHLWYNPQKHGVIENAEEWAFGSLYHRAIKEAQYIHTLRESYPFDSVKVRDDY